LQPTAKRNISHSLLQPLHHASSADPEDTCDPMEIMRSSIACTNSLQQPQQTAHLQSKPVVKNFSYPFYPSIPVTKAPTPAPVIAGPSTRRNLPTPPPTNYSPSVVSSTTACSGSRKITSALSEYPKTRRNGTIDKGKAKVLNKEEEKVQMGRSVGGVHMMSFSGSGQIWDHKRV
jgi:hypothetical protein